MTDSTHCPGCGLDSQGAKTECPHCGSALPLVVDLPVVTVKVTGQPVGLVLAGRDPATGDMKVRVDAATGVKSESRHGSDGMVSLEVSGAVGIGEDNEAHVAKILRARLIQQGLMVEVHEGQNDRGADRTLRVGDRDFPLQITTAPAAPAFWRDATISSAFTRVPERQAADWLRAPIARKAERLQPRALRASTVLAIDAHFVGVLALPPLIEEYLRVYGAPIVEFGFASVWVVGPTVQQCHRVGDGMP